MGMVLSFDISGPFGQYKKPYTTACPLSYSVPTPTAILGMIGAILGLGREEYSTKLQDAGIKIAIGINNPVKKIRMSFNLREAGLYNEKTDTITIEKRVPQIKCEFLKDCSYRIYVTGDSELLNKLRDAVKSGDSYYTPSLGVAQCLAKVTYVGMFAAEDVKVTTQTEMSTVVPADYKICVQPKRTYYKETLPVTMSADRRATYRAVIFDPGGDNISIYSGTCTRITRRASEENLVWL